jgi:hypothetical protein
MNKIFFAALPLLAALAVSGCSELSLAHSAASIVGVNSHAPDNEIIESTAQTLGLEPGDITLSNRADKGDKTTFIAKTKAGRRYSCYVTSMYLVGSGWNVSDAMCTQKGKAKSVKPAKKGQGCNDLLQAAGKC